jgi:DNA-binding MarR family transcriptional regulator
MAQDHSPFFRILLLVDLIARPFARVYERSHNIKLIEWRVMRALRSTPGLSGTELGERLGLDKMAISRAVRGLETNEWLIRAVDPQDHRRALLTLTETGVAMCDKIRPSSQAGERHLLSALNAQEQRQLDVILEKLIVRARDMADPHTP